MWKDLHTAHLNVSTLYRFHVSIKFSFHSTLKIGNDDLVFYSQGRDLGFISKHPRVVKRPPIVVKHPAIL